MSSKKEEKREAADFYLELMPEAKFICHVIKSL